MVLTEQDGRTTLVGTVLFPSREARDAALATGMNGAAALSFRRLDEYLRTLA